MSTLQLIIYAKKTKPQHIEKLRQLIIDGEITTEAQVDSYNG